MDKKRSPHPKGEKRSPLKKWGIIIGVLAILGAASVFALSGPDLAIQECTYFREGGYLQDTRFTSAADVWLTFRHFSESSKQRSLPVIINTSPSIKQRAEELMGDVGIQPLAAPYAILLVDELDGKSRHHFIDIPSLPVAPRLKDARTLIVFSIKSESQKRDYWGGISFHNVDDRHPIHQYREYLELSRDIPLNNSSITFGRNQFFKKMLEQVIDFTVAVEPGQDSYANLRKLSQQLGLDSDSRLLSNAFAGLNDSAPPSQPAADADGLLYDLGYEITDIKAIIRSDQNPEEVQSAMGGSDTPPELDILFATPGCFFGTGDSALVVFAYISGTNTVGVYGHSLSEHKAYDVCTRIVVMNWESRQTVMSGSLTNKAPQKILASNVSLPQRGTPTGAMLRNRMASLEEISAFVRASFRPME